MKDKEVRVVNGREENEQWVDANDMIFSLAQMKLPAPAGSFIIIADRKS